MIELNELLEKLGYNESSHYRHTDGPLDLETAHLFRAARDAGVNGVYVFEVSPSSTNRLLAPRPAVYVAKAHSEEVAREIHRSLWNLGYAPFLIILLPNQIRIYTGFSYSEESKEQGLLDKAEKLEQLVELLNDFKASSIDTGFIWKSKYSKALDQDQRVDKRLLQNLEQLGKALEDEKLPAEVSHALIGKYVYLSYLRSRNILTDEWMKKQGIELEKVFSSDATVFGLRKLVEALEDRFNGRIFPIDFDKESALKDEHISWVASVFSGAKVIKTAPDSVRQLHLPFRAYDFRYIPVETLSAIYEQFIRDRKEKGAIYTPEILADYVLSEMEWAKPLKQGMRILDPACGSGVFLVLAYRRLIEKELHHLGLGEKLKPEKLCDILLESIYGIERETDACYVAEFSLILTLLHYTEPRDLQSLKFKFPALHNTRIFECDFFDLKGEESETKFWQMGLKFDWITGNPPWVELTPGMAGTKFVRHWMDNVRNKSEHPIGGKRVAEAFSWLVTDLLGDGGIVGLILPGTSLFNLESKKYRQSFFTENEILRITNFANLRDVLFGKDKSGVLPAVTMIYRKIRSEGKKTSILHYGPFSMNQISGGHERPWVITVNENEIKTVSPYEAGSGEMSVWKLALWGTYRDKRTIERIQRYFPMTLEGFCEVLGWGKGLPRQGAELRPEQTNPRWVKVNVKGQKQFDTTTFSKIEPHYRFSIPDTRVLKEITEDMFIRRGADTLHLTTPSPHVIISASWQNFAIYSDEDFIIPPRQMAIAAPRYPKENDEYLRALTIYLSSSLVAYYLFFQVPQWGIFSQRRSVVTNEVRGIPTPNFKIEQAKELASLHREVVSREEAISVFLTELYKRSHTLNDSYFSSDIEISGNLSKTHKQEVNHFALELQSGLQRRIDNKVFDLFEVPADIRSLTEEFVQTRLLLDKPSARNNVTREPTVKDLLAYAKQLRNELDSFVMGSSYHRVTIIYSKELIECTVEVTKKDSPIPINTESIKTGSLKIAELLDELSKNLRDQVSQWVYVQQGLRLYDGPRIHIYKMPRFIDWTIAQAMDDAADIIGTIVATK